MQPTLHCDAVEWYRTAQALSVYHPSYRVIKLQFNELCNNRRRFTTTVCGGGMIGFVLEHFIVTECTLARWLSSYNTACFDLSCWLKVIIGLFQIILA